MRPGGKRRIVVSPELGPPVGPSTFFSAKQFEVFDIELRQVLDAGALRPGVPTHVTFFLQEDEVLGPLP